MIVDQSLDLSRYEDFVGTIVRDEHLIFMGRIESFAIDDSECWHARSVIAVLDNGIKVYARNVPELQGLLEVSI